MSVEIVHHKVPLGDQPESFPPFRRICLVKSSSVRVLRLQDTFPICPVQTLKVHDKRRPSHAECTRIPGRSTLPGAIGNPGCLRSNA